MPWTDLGLMRFIAALCYVTVVKFKGMLPHFGIFLKRLINIGLNWNVYTVKYLVSAHLP